MEAKTYKWSLRKGGRKMRCPNCGQMRFVPYVLTADMKTLAGEDYGRCDREQNCGYQRYPSEIEAPNIKPIVEDKKEPLRFYPSAVSMDIKTNLFDYVSHLCGVRHALAIWNRYQIGNDAGRTIFWQIAYDGTIRAGKSIPYALNGHRIKNDPMPANWLHKSKAWKGYYSGEELQQCYFGEHLLRNNERPVILVESEKTAAILSEYSRRYVWLASGGSQNVKNDAKNEVLKNRNVLMIPDHGQYWNWAAVAAKNGWQITDAIERSPIFEGCDILDMLEAGVLGEELLTYMKK